MIHTVVVTSESARANQMPSIPNALGSRIKLGMRKIMPRNKAKTVAGRLRSIARRISEQKLLKTAHYQTLSI